MILGVLAPLFWCNDSVAILVSLMRILHECELCRPVKWSNLRSPNEGISLSDGLRYSQITAIAVSSHQWGTPLLKTPTPKKLSWKYLKLSDENEIVAFVQLVELWTGSHEVNLNSCNAQIMQKFHQTLYIASNILWNFKNVIYESYNVLLEQKRNNYHMEECHWRSLFPSGLYRKLWVHSVCCGSQCVFMWAVGPCDMGLNELWVHVLWVWMISFVRWVDSLMIALPPGIALVGMVISILRFQRYSINFRLSKNHFENPSSLNT